MHKFILNEQDIETDVSPGTTVLDFVRYHQDLTGTKIGCREGDCGACTVLVGELVDDRVRYRSMTSCLMPLANADGKHIVTIEGINRRDGSLTPVQKALVDEAGTQCGFCTVGFVMSLTGYCIDGVSSPHVGKDSAAQAISSVDGNICRCTGYKSIERAAIRVCNSKAESPASAGGRTAAVNARVVPQYFETIAPRLRELVQNRKDFRSTTDRSLTPAVPPFVGGGTDVYVQKPDKLAEINATHLFFDDDLRTIRPNGEFIELGASVTVTDLLESPLMLSIFPRLYDHLKLVSSTPIRNMATLAGNFVNASPIGDMTIWFIALNAEIVFNTDREILLRQLFLDYKKLAKEDDEFITTIRFRKPFSDFRFNFEKVSKRTYLDIATVNTAASFRTEAVPGRSWMPPAIERRQVRRGNPSLDHFITEAHVSAGGVAPIPLYLKETSSFLIGRYVNDDTIKKATDIMQAEISPISDVRGSEEYKRLLLSKLFRAHFYELFGLETV